MMVPVAVWDVERGIRALLPCLTIALAIVVDALPLPVASPATPAPLVVLAVLSFWALHRPDLVPPGRVFVLGLMADAVLSLPLGFTALTLLATVAAVGAGRGFVLGQPFLTTWLALALLVAAVELLRWTVAAVLLARPIAVPQLLAEGGLTIAVWPLAAAMLRPLLDLLPAARHAPGD